MSATWGNHMVRDWPATGATKSRIRPPRRYYHMPARSSENLGGSKMPDPFIFYFLFFFDEHLGEKLSDIIGPSHPWFSIESPESRVLWDF